MRKILAASAALLFLLPTALYLGLRLGLATPLLNWTLKKELSGLFNGEVRFGLFRTDLLSFAEISDLMVLTTQDGSKVPVLTLGRLRLRYSAWEHLRGRQALEDSLELASISGLKVFLLRDMQGKWNLKQVLKLPKRKEGAAPAKAAKMPMLATRLVLEDSTIIFNDRRRDFQSTLENVQATLDARAFPLVAFSMSGRTEDQKRDNLSMAGEWNAEEESLYARADMDDVALRTYLNYALPAGGLGFEGGTASLSVRLRRRPGEEEMDFAGRADVNQGSLRIPGVAEPLTQFEGQVLFGADKLVAKSVSASFLGSRWQASGEVSNLRSPELALVLGNEGVPLEALSTQIRGLAALNLSGTAAISVTATGKAVQPRVRGTLRAPLLGLAGVEMEQVEAGLEMDRSGLKVPSLRARLWGGRLEASAEVGFPRAAKGDKGSLSAQVVGEGLDLSRVRFRGRNYLPITGTASLKASLKGALKEPELEARLDCPAAWFGKRNLKSFGLEVGLQGRSLAIRLSTWQGRLEGSMGLDFSQAARFTATSVRLRGLPVADILEGIATSPPSDIFSPKLQALAAGQAGRYEGVADLELELAGPARSPEMQLRVFSHQGLYKVKEGFFASKDKKGLPISAEGVMQLGGGRLGFGGEGKPFKLLLSHKGRQAGLLLSGSLPYRGPGEPGKSLSARLEADLRAMEAFRIFKSAEGDLEGELEVSGSLDAPSYQGRLELKDGGARMEDWFSQIRNIKLSARIKDQALAIDNVSFDSKGSFSAKGHLELAAGRPPVGRIEASTGPGGIFMEKQDRLRGMLSLEPLVLAFEGAEGLALSGKLKFENLEYRMPTKRRIEAALEPGAAAGPAKPSLPLRFDLRAQLGENVWLKKIHKGLGLDDPVTLLKNALYSAEETVLSPAFEFRFRPTHEDFLVRGQRGDLKLRGQLEIERGTLNFMENNFVIRQDRTAPKVTFSDEVPWGVVRAEATAKLRYYRPNKATGKNEIKSVFVTAYIVPMDDEAVRKAGLENNMVNFKLAFCSEPPLTGATAPCNPEDAGREATLEDAAILSLLVLGDPMVDLDPNLQRTEAAATAGMSPDEIFMYQVNRFASGEVRKVVSKGLKFIGGRFLDFDYVYLAPRFRSYRGSAPAVAAGAPGTQNLSAAGQSQFAVSWMAELGKSFLNDFYASGQFMFFGEDDVNTAKGQYITGDVPKEVRNVGVKLGLEYHLGPGRMLETSFSYSMDENQDPVAFDPSQLEQARRLYIGLRNTIPTTNYTPRMAKQRKKRKMLESQPEEKR